MRWPVASSCNVISRAHRATPTRFPLKQQSHRQKSTDDHNLSPDGTEEKPLDPQLADLGLTIKDDFAKFRERYDVPKNPIVLAHGLMGFDELRLAGKYLPGVQYWRGITDAMHQNQIDVITTAVPSTGSIEERGRALHEQIKLKATGKSVNIVAHSMGGLDARYLISQIQPQEYTVKSLTTIATPHRGSSAADIILREIGPDYLPRLYSVLTRMRVSTGAFSQLTRQYVCETFNTCTPDVPAVRYFSYGASCTPHLFSVFRVSHDLIYELEGPNDGLVSVASSRWGGCGDGGGDGNGDGYKGTLMNVTHLDLINWTNRIKRVAARMSLVRQDFNAIAFYLHITDMLAKEGL